MKHVHHVSKAVPGLVNTKNPVACHVPLLAFAFPATCAALRSFHVDINAQAFVERTAPKDIATFVLVKVTLG
jgi:hypothetical protein